MILYRTRVSDVHVAKNHDENGCRYSENSLRVRRPPFMKNSAEPHDSVMGESKIHGGDTLRYREFILYDRSQTYPEYVIRFKRSAANACSRLISNKSKINALVSRKMCSIKKGE